MTKQEAAERVAKLIRLARDNANPHEAEAARSQARKIVTEHDLSVEELSAGQKAAAFDELLTKIQRVVSSHPAVPEGLFDTSSVISGLVSKMETMTKESKSKRLDEACKLLDAAAMVDGILGTVGLSTSLIRTVKKIFDDTLAAHNLTR